nr:hypothetical protein [Natronospirillum operosum]
MTRSVLADVPVDIDTSQEALGRPGYFLDDGDVPVIVYETFILIPGLDSSQSALIDRQCDLSL